MRSCSAFVPYLVLRGLVTRIARRWVGDASGSSSAVIRDEARGPHDESTRMERLRSAARRLKPERGHLASDLVAALTFAVVNVPQAMGHALLAMVNPVLGIYTLMVAVPVGAIFTSSVFMNVSTTGALSVAAGVVLLEFPAGQRAEALVVLVLLVGVIQLLAGLFRLGFLIRFVSNAVMTGFLNGVAVLIILGQLSDLTGYQSSFSNRVAQALDLLLRLGQVNLQATAIGVLTLALIVALLWHKVLQRFAFIIAIAVATVLLVLLTPAGPAHGRPVRRRAHGRRHLGHPARAAATGAAAAVAGLVAVAAGLVHRHHRPGAGRRRQPGHAQPRRPLPRRVARLPRPGGGQHGHQPGRRHSGRRLGLGHGADRRARGPGRAGPTSSSACSWP